MLKPVSSLKNIMDNQQAGFAQLLMKTILPKVQLIAIGICVIGFVLLFMNNTGAETLLRAGLSTLAGCYFLLGFAPLPSSPDSKPNLYLPVVYKVIYIALAVAVIGILFVSLKLEGADTMLLLGCGVLTLGLLISAIMVVINHDNLGVLKKPLLNGIALLMIGVYFINKLSLISF
ncbi:MAG: hypothetical protein JNM78_15395 [Cyclobacteriaceae bacterium]|nr:hypothetical protein [Cyclobacteriaceae bacterium]